MRATLSILYPGRGARSRKEGFTGIELMIVFAIVGLLAAMLVRYQHVRSIEKARATTCQYNRALIDRAEQSYALEKGRPSQNFADLVDAGYLKAVPVCPSKGVYAWASPAQEAIVCSVHSQAQTAATSLGTTFAEITGGMIGLIDAFFEKNGRYPRSFGSYAYTDLGLDPAEWAKSYDGLFYRPIGGRVSVKPAAGYAITVTGADGQQRVLTPSLNWSVWYDAPTAQWYYHVVAPEEAVDIKTLAVKKI